MEQHNSKGNGMAVAALTLGIASIPTICCCGFGLPIAATGVILALLSRRGHTMNPQAKVGFGLSLSSLIITVVGLIAVFAFVCTTDEFQVAWDAISEIDLGQFEDQEEMEEYLYDYLEDFYNIYQETPSYGYEDFYSYPDMPSYDFNDPDITFQSPGANTGNLI